MHGQAARDGRRLAAAGEVHGGIAAGSEHVWRQSLLLAVGIGHVQACHLDCDVDAAPQRMRALQDGNPVEALKSAMHRHEAQAKDRVADLAIGGCYRHALRQSRPGQAQADEPGRARSGATRGLCILQRTP